MILSWKNPANETDSVIGLSDGAAYYVRRFVYAISGSSRIICKWPTGRTQHTRP